MVTEVQVNPVSALRGQKRNLEWPAADALAPALSEDVAWLIQRLLRGVVTDGSSRRLKRYKGEVIEKRALQMTQKMRGSLALSLIHFWRLGWL